MVTFTTIKRFEGTSEDTKPTSGLLKIGDMFAETDTKKIFMWDGEDWVLLKDLSS